MEYNIESKPTKFKGILFRSQLEARWAYYFEFLSIKWIYEPKRFFLKDGKSYLPDFYFPEINLYAEVKPKYCYDSRWRDFINENQELNNEIGEVGLVIILLNVTYRCHDIIFKDNNSVSIKFAGQYGKSFRNQKHISTGHVRRADDNTMAIIKYAQKRIFTKENENYL